MKCPNCGVNELYIVDRCPNCRLSFPSQDLIELNQLEFLLKETLTWPHAEPLRKPYADRLVALRTQLLPPKPSSQSVSDTSPIAVQKAAEQPKPAPVRTEAVPKPPAPKKEAVPFDQWLLSERNLKIALYTGGILLVIAGLIFIGVNWTRIPGPVKFAILLAITGSMYLGGAQLSRRPRLRMGGIALLAIASGFLPLNMAVLQLYVFRPMGLDDRVVWLVGSFFVAFIYLLTSFFTHAGLFTYLAIAAVTSGVTAGITLANFPMAAYPPAYILLVLVFLLLARAVRSTGVASFAYFPPLIVSQVAAPAVFVLASLFWMLTTGCTTLQSDNNFCSTGSPWLSIAALVFVTFFYLVTDLAFLWKIARWAWAACFGFTSILVLVELKIPTPANFFIMLVEGFIFLLTGSILQQRTANLSKALPLFAAGYTLAALNLLSILIPGIAPEEFALLLVGDVLLLAASARVHRAWIWLYGAAWLFVIPAAILAWLYLSQVKELAMMGLALAYLILGKVPILKTKNPLDGWRLFAASYLIAFFVTAWAVYSQPVEQILLILLADVILLAVSYWVHGSVYWAYGAAWLMIAPVTVFGYRYLPGWVETGLLLGLLMLVYAAVGYRLSRRKRPLSWPFLSAAAFLSVAILPLLWMNPVAASLALLVEAALYLLFALSLRQAWLLLPALSAVHLLIVAILDISSSPSVHWIPPLTKIYAVLGITLCLAGFVLKRFRRPMWAWPLLLVAVLDMAATYSVGLYLGGGLAIGLSATYGLLALAVSWVEEKTFGKKEVSRFLVYLGLGIFFTGHFYLFAPLEHAWLVWPPYTAGFCALLVIISWLVHRDDRFRFFEQPLHQCGLVLMFVPLLGSILASSGRINMAVVNTQPVYVATPFLVIYTFVISSAIYLADSILRRSPLLRYLGGGMFIVAYWYLLKDLQVSELQAYVIPAGLWLVLIGWNEQRLGRLPTYVMATFLGLLVLLASAFIQSFDAPIYAALMMVESLFALSWGIHIRSRGFVQVAALAILVDAVAQFGPAFAELQRWVQIGIIGSILLGGGLYGLFKREEIITTREHFSEGWKKWNF